MEIERAAFLNDAKRLHTSFVKDIGLASKRAVAVTKGEEIHEEMKEHCEGLMEEVNSVKQLNEDQRQ